MLISLNWLEELLTGPNDPRLDPRAVELALTGLGLEVEGVHRYGTLAGVVVGEVKALAPHPDADKLRVVTLFDGEETLEVVCGAKNVPAPGGKVAFARVGAVLPGGFEIGRRKLRGVESSGMICSEAELDIGPDDEGIMVLPDAWSAGTLLSDAVPGIEDTVIEISVTPNRPDALGHVGVARDLAAKMGRRLLSPMGLKAETIDAATQDDTLVTVVSAARERCGRYRGFALEGAHVEASPLWVRVRLHRVGLRPISNVVDITNLCLMEYGQPMHAFDRARLGEGRVVVRPANAGEKMTTLDGTEIEMRDADLVIGDATAPQALAGVMGGEHSMVDTNSKQLLLEVAYFDPARVRATAKHHGFHTDSSHRFERGVDWGAGLDAASARALWLLQDLCDAKLVARHEVQDPAGLPARPSIPLRPRAIGALLGMEVPADEARSILEAIGIQVEEGEYKGEVAWSCRAPTHRPDLHLEVDLIEEVMRFHGLEHLPAQGVARFDRLEPAPPRALIDRVAEAMAASGLHEIVSLGFEDPDLGGRLHANETRSPTRPVHVDNPLRQQDSWLRTHMLVNLLECAKLNMARHARALALFETGRVYDWAKAPNYAAKTAESDARLPRERERAAALWAGEGLRMRDAVHLLLGTFARLGRSVRVLNLRAGGNLQLDPDVAHADVWHPGVCAVFVDAGGRKLGAVGEVHPDLVAAWDLSRDWPVAYAELWLENWTAGENDGREFRSLPRFPSSARDMSLDLSLDVDVASLVEAMRKAARAASKSGEEIKLSMGDTSAHPIELLADYRGDGVEAGRRSLSFRLHYRAEDRSPKDDEVQALHERVLAAALDQAKTIDPAAKLR